MNLHEFQAKQIFASYGIPVSKGKVAETSQAAREAFSALGVKIAAIKAQIHAGGRGKGGGIKLAKTPDEAEKFASAMLGKPLITPQTGPEGRIVRKVLIEEGCDIVKELYTSITIDRAKAMGVLMVSAEGGMEIEELAVKSPKKILKENFYITGGLKSFQARKIAYKLGVDTAIAGKLAGLLINLSNVFVEKDCGLVEINPLVITKGGNLLALDAKINIDDRAVSMHKDLEAMRDPNEEDPREFEATLTGLNYISMPGNIGCMVNGAGLAMATMDIIKLAGGMPANFLDVGGGASKEQVATAFKLLVSHKGVNAILINIFGGILKCDILAQGICDALKEVKVNMPLVVRLEGTNVEQGRKILNQSGLAITTATNMADAAEKVVKASKR